MPREQEHGLRAAARALNKWLDVRWQQITGTLRILQLVRFSFVIVVLGVAALVLNDQGQEIAIGGGERGRDFFWYPFSALVCALQVWFWARFLLAERYPRETGKPPPPSAVTYLPRILGTVSGAIPLVASLVVVARNQQSVATYWLIAELAAALVLFVLFVINRVEIAKRLAIRAQVKSTPDSFGAGIGRAVVIVSAVQVLIWGVWASAQPLAFGTALGAAPVLLLGLASIVPVGSLLVYVTRNATFPTVSALVLVGVGCSSCDPHYMRETASPTTGRPTLSHELSRWFAAAPAPQDGDRKTLVVVATAGGGITAAYWTSAILTHLQAADHDFPRRLFAVSSVSGGSIGTAMYSQALACAATNGRFPEKYDKVWDGDLLGPTLAAALYRDLAFWFPPFSVAAHSGSSPDDRAAIFETQLERQWAGALPECARKLDVPFLAQRAQSPAWLPILLLNSTHQETGLPVVLSQVQLARAANAAHPAQPFAPAIDYFARAPHDLRLSTAALNSARFPIVSPAGGIRPWPARGDAPPIDGGHLLDGGYFDNDGAVTLLELLQSIENEKEMADTRVIVIQISIDPAGPLDAPAQTADPRWIGDQVAHAPHGANDLLAPVYGFASTRDAHGYTSRRALENWVRMRTDGSAYFHFRVLLPRESPAHPRPAQPPLGWLLSEHSKYQLGNETLCLDTNYTRWMKLMDALGVAAENPALASCGRSEPAPFELDEANVP